MFLLQQSLFPYCAECASLCYLEEIGYTPRVFLHPPRVSKLCEKERMGDNFRQSRQFLSSYDIAICLKTPLCDRTKRRHQKLVAKFQGQYMTVHAPA